MIFWFKFKLLFERKFEEGSLIYMLSDLYFNKIYALMDGIRNLSFIESQLVQFVKTIVLILKLQGKRESTRLWKYLSLEHKANW